jgi:Bardet-Biedl syndrome 2 protein
LHSPHEHSTQTAEGQLPAVRYLNLNRKLTAIAAGSLTDDPKAPEILFIGSPTSFLAYDVERNADVFYKEVQDGVNAIKIGHPVSSRSKQLIFVGGNCSIVGFDKTGTEAFWTVVCIAYEILSKFMPYFIIPVPPYIFADWRQRIVYGNG